MRPRRDSRRDQRSALSASLAVFATEKPELQQRTSHRNREGSIATGKSELQQGTLHCNGGVCIATTSQHFATEISTSQQRSAHCNGEGDIATERVALQQRSPSCDRQLCIATGKPRSQQRSRNRNREVEVATGKPVGASGGHVHGGFFDGRVIASAGREHLGNELSGNPRDLAHSSYRCQRLYWRAPPAVAGETEVPPALPRQAPGSP